MKLTDVCVKLENEAQLDRLIKACGKMKIVKNLFWGNDCFRYVNKYGFGNWFLTNGLVEVTESEFLKMLPKKRGPKPKGNVQYHRRIKPEYVSKLDNYLKKLENGNN